jgi:hypothetical protein
MKFATARPYADPEASMQKLLEYAKAFEPIHDGRIYIEKLNGPFLFEARGSPAGIQGRPRPGDRTWTLEDARERHTFV